MFEKKQTVPKRFKELVRRQASVQRTEEALMGLVRPDLEFAVSSVLFSTFFSFSSFTLPVLCLLFLVVQVLLIILIDLPRCDSPQHLQY